MLGVVILLARNNVQFAYVVYRFSFCHLAICCSTAYNTTKWRGKAGGAAEPLLLWSKAMIRPIFLLSAVSFLFLSSSTSKFAECRARRARSFCQYKLSDAEEEFLLFVLMMGWYVIMNVKPRAVYSI